MEQDMRKRNRGRQPTPGELSQGRVEYLEQARQRLHAKRLRRSLAIVAVLAALVLFGTGLLGTSVSVVKDFADTARITLFPGRGWPQQTGVMNVSRFESLTGSFVALGDEGCVVYSNTGSRLNSIQTGYTRPALDAGKTRFVLYNRSGTELRVESRTQNLYTKTMENAIFLCEMSDNGTLAVVTADATSMSKLYVYSPTMEQQLTWSMNSNEGTPLRMAFSPDSRRLAAAAVTASGGEMMTNLYVITLAQGQPISVGNEAGVPQWVGWLNGNTLMAIYDDRAVLYNAAGGERGSYDFGGLTLRDLSVDDAGNVGLLLVSGQMCQAVTLDKNLNVQFAANVPSANYIVRAGSSFYLLTDTSVECYTSGGDYQWAQALSSRPQGLLVQAGRILVACGNTVQQVTAPVSTS